jgi:hypothetical protein
MIWPANNSPKAEQLPGYGTMTYGQLKLMPYWDSLRGDPRFENIVASLVPKMTEKQRNAETVWRERIIVAFNQRSPGQFDRGLVYVSSKQREHLKHLRLVIWSSVDL